MAFYFVSTFAIAQTPTKQPALRLSRTKNLHFAKAPFPGFSATGVTAPVTLKFKGLSTVEIVNDCFQTDAETVTNLVTQKVSQKINGVFVHNCWYKPFSTQGAHFPYVGTFWDPAQSTCFLTRLKEQL
ncbi:MAG: hypothetical protein H0A75_04370 [Candidatus Methanofishera endochildressiae]|uniref:Uncharacterized protein n=1 Tax=Candidatus Methanofishera endochildressiae TaxID=2738884 RepID=A0A7Z0MP28_9GAMM|nr:hypothetical protein [Candidatus Methanofishera endochildressiae]